MKDIELAQYNLETVDESRLVQVLGLGKIVSSAEAFEHDLETDWLVYATLGPSTTYGSPAFWFTYPQTFLKLVGSKVAHGDDRLFIEEDTILRRTKSCGAANLHVDMVGLGTYRAIRLGTSQYEIYPDGYF